MPKVWSKTAKALLEKFGLEDGTKLGLLPASMTAIVCPAPVPLIPPPKSSWSIPYAV